MSGVTAKQVAKEVGVDDHTVRTYFDNWSEELVADEES